MGPGARRNASDAMCSIWGERRALQAYALFGAVSDGAAADGIGLRQWMLAQRRAMVVGFLQVCTGKGLAWGKVRRAGHDAPCNGDCMPSWLARSMHFILDTRLDALIWCA